MIDFVKALKDKHDLRLVAISNEGPELAQYRIDAFGLRDFIDAFYVSGFLHTRKPDVIIFQTALDSMQANVHESAYMDDRMLFVEVAATLGLNAFQHTSLGETTEALGRMGLAL
jgi:putative hydrolase of the HAD superfamily